MAERVLVRLPNWLGDVLLARPLLHALRASLPGASITGVAPGPLLELIASDGVLDEAVAWPGGGDARRALVSRMRAWRPDVALVLPPSFSSAWFAFRSGARTRVGYGHEGRAWLLTRPLRRGARGDAHLSEEYLRLGEEIGVRPRSDFATPSLLPPASGRDEADAIVARQGWIGRDLAVLAPGAIYGPAKRWPADRFAALARRLAERGLRVFVCGTRSERPVCDEVARGAGEGVLSIAGETTLPALAGICARARLAVCNDSGLAHLAAALGTRTVTVFGSTSSAWTAPLGRRVRVVQRAPVCSPCFRRSCRIGYTCLRSIDVADVARAGEELAH
jgi:heptosyltransferase-2